MNIFFCDSCGARVTDADLSRGYGLQKEDITVCGLCIDRNKGIEVFRASASGGHAVLVEEPAVEEQQTPEPAVQTTPAHVAEAPAAEEPEPAALDAELHEAPRETDHDLIDSDLGHSPDLLDLGDTVDDLKEVEHHDLDESGVYKAGNDVIDLGSEPTDEPQGQVETSEIEPVPESELQQSASRQASANRGDTQNKQLPDRSRTTSRQKTGSGHGKKDGKSQSRRANKGGNKSGVKSSKRNNGRGSSSRKNANNNNKVMVISMISIGCLILIFVALVMTKGDGSQIEGAGQKSASHNGELKKVAVEVEAMVVDALRSEDLAKLKQAKIGLSRLRSAIEKFERHAKVEGWDDEKVARAVRSLGCNDVLAQYKTINDKIAILDR